MERHVVFCFILSFAVHVFAQNLLLGTDPSIVFNTDVPTAGNQIRISFTNNDTRSASWYLKRPNETEIQLAVDATAVQFQKPTKRLFAVHRANSSNWIIEFRPLNRNDLGDLSCEYLNNQTLIRVTRFLDVHSEPVIQQSSTRKVNISVGGNFTLACIANGYPASTFQWAQTFDNGATAADLIQRWTPFINNWQPLVADGPILTVTNASRIHRGNYTCSAKNGVGNTTWNAKVQVNFAPSVTCFPEKVGQAQQVNANAYLECIVSAYPPATLRWFQVSNTTGMRQPVNASSHFLKGTSMVFDYVVSQLTLVNVIAGDYGEYQLTATNSYGEDKSSALLYETQINPQTSSTWSSSSSSPSSSSTFSSSSSPSSSSSSPSPSSSSLSTATTATGNATMTTTSKSNSASSIYGPMGMGHVIVMLIMALMGFIILVD